MSEIAQHIAVSKKVDFEDLDWKLARRHGLTPHEIESLGYFADVESQTVYYFLEVAKLQVAKRPEFLTFLTMWNYEEYFHSHALRQGARLKATLEDWFQIALSRLAPDTFIALWMTWGATQELLTTQAYEEIAATTSNPVAEELCRRIAKQERRHFAYYFGQARKRLEGRSWAQRFTRWIAKKFYAPVGGGVKTDAEGARLVAQLFPGDRIFEVMSYIEKRMAQLPGMDSLDCCTRWAAKVQPMLPPETRATSVPLLSAAA